MKNRTDLINYFIKKYNYKKYLEIGVFDPNRNFNDICLNYKIGIDPNIKSKSTLLLTSDDYFRLSDDKFDIIFIDGLHIKEQVIKDIKNSIKCLNDNGVIIVHDCNPKDEISQKVPKETHHWNGNVWESFIYMRTKIDGFDFYVIDMDEGCGVIQQNNYNKKIQINHQINYENFVKYKKEWLNLISVDDFLKLNQRKNNYG